MASRTDHRITTARAMLPTRAQRRVGISVTWISVNALPTDPVCPYRIHYREEYLEEHTRYSRIRYGEYMDAGDSAIMVFNCPSLEDPTIKQLVAFSVWSHLASGIWQLPGTHVKNAPANDEATEEKAKPKPKGPPDHLQRRDASPARMMAFRAVIGKAKTEWFDDKYGEKQLYLGMLACSPDYQKPGAGKMLVRWGLEG